MKRKINLVGAGTLTVSFPTKWTKKLNLKKGDEVEIEEIGNTLVISPEIKYANKEQEIDITDVPTSAVWRMLRGLYCIGCTQITVKFNNSFIENTSSRTDLRKESPKKEMYSFLRDVTSRLISMNIIDHSTNKVIIRETSKLSHDDLNMFIKKIFKSLVILGSELYQACLTSDEGKLKNILYFDDDINSYTDVCFRLLNNPSFSHNTSLLLIMVTYLELIGDSYIHILKIQSTQNIKMEKQTLVMFQKVNNLFLEFNSLYVSGGDIIEVNKKAKQLSHDLETKNKTQITNPEYLFFFKQIIEHINEMFLTLYGMKYSKELN